MNKLDINIYSRFSKIKYLSFSLFFVIVFLSLSACAPSLYTETDRVTNTRYVKCEMYFRNNNFREPQYSQQVIVAKETKRNQEPIYTWYDALTLSVQNFDIDMDNIFLIIDNEIFPVKSTYVKRQGEQRINENKTDVMQSDSTKISVVTGYDVVQKNIYQMTHPVSSDVMNRILDANEVIIRYTAGAQFINSEIKGKNLKNLKKLIIK